MLATDADLEAGLRGAATADAELDQRADAIAIERDERVDGQYALGRPELGLSNWQNGRLFARGAVLSGDGVFTVRTRVRQADPGLDRAGAPTPPRRA